MNNNEYVSNIDSNSILNLILRSVLTTVANVTTEKNEYRYKKFDVAFKCIDVIELAKLGIFESISDEEISNHARLIVQILYLLGKDKNYFELRYDIFKNFYSALFDIINEEIQTTKFTKDFAMQIIQRILAPSIYDNDLDFLTLTLVQLNKSSNYKFNFYTTVLMFNINLFVKYIVDFEPNIPQEVRINLIKWYNRDETIDNCTRVRCLGEIVKTNYYTQFIDKPFELLKCIQRYFDLWYWEYDLFFEFKKVFITPEFIFDNFVIYLIKSYYNLKIENFKQLNDTVKEKFYQCAKVIFKSDNKINKKHFDKYKNRIDPFDVTSYIDSNVFDSLLEFKKEMDKKVIEETLEEESKISNEEYCKPIRDSIEKQIQNEYGWGKIKIQNQEQYIYEVSIEKDIVTVNHQKVLASMISGGIIKTVKSLTSFTELNIYELNQDFSKLKNAGITSITSYCKWAIFNDCNIVTNEELKKFINGLEEIGFPNTIKNKSILNSKEFKFNVELDEFKPIKLTDAQISEEISKYQKSGNKYFYNGVIYDKEQMEEIIKSHYFILKILFRVEIKHNKDSCFVITK